MQAPTLLITLLALAPAAAAADFSTYIGDAYAYTVAAAATDAAGNAYITGSRTIPAAAGAGSSNPLSDVFVTKLDPSGQILFTTTFGGKANDRGLAIALDSSGNMFVAGMTTSANFPLRRPLQSSIGRVSTGFLVKLDSEGAMVFSTFLGGTKGDSLLDALATDEQGNVYVAGSTGSSDYPHTPGLPGPPASGLVPGGVVVAFFAKISASGELVWGGAVSATTRACSGGSSCFLSALYASVTGIAVDVAGNTYIFGNTNGGGLPTTPGALAANGLGAFAMKVNAGGMSLGYVTYLSARTYGVPEVPSASTFAAAVAVDTSGDVYLTGATSDPGFSTTIGSYQPGFSIPASQINGLVQPPRDVFIAKLNSAGSAMVWATFLGGKNEDDAQSLALDSAGNVWVSGVTYSSDFPVGAPAKNGSDFLAEIDAAGAKLSYGAILPYGSAAQSIAVDPSGTAHLAGTSGIVSTLTPSQAGSARIFAIANAAGGTVAGRIAPGELISIYGTNLGPAAPVSAAFDEAGFLPTTLGSVQVDIGGTPAPLLYVSATQINAVVPMALAPGSAASLQITANGTSPPPFRVAIDLVDPQIFSNPDGSALAINQDGTVNSENNPAKIYSYVSIWATGTGAFLGVDGQRADSAQMTCFCVIQSAQTYPSVTVYPTPYAGTSPGFVNGVTQINFQVPFANSFEQLGITLSVQGATAHASVYIAP